MPRGYRRYILAAFGCLILAASPPQQRGRPQDDNAEQEIANSLKGIDSALHEANQPREHDEPCRDGRDNSRSDLCAQWTAANAAQESTVWTSRGYYLGIWGLVIGFLTLLAAGAAAWFAKKAAEHTEAGANEAKRQADAAAHSLEISRSELRAKIIPDETELEWNAETRELKVITILKNSGATSAHDFVVMSKSSFTKNGQPIQELESGSFNPGTLGPGGSARLVIPFSLSEAQAVDLTDGAGAIKIELNGPFTDDFGDKWNVYLRHSVNRGALQMDSPFTDDCRQTRRSEPPKDMSGDQPKLL